MDLQLLKRDLKELIVTEGGKEIDPETISDTEPLFGEGSVLELDSLDALQISVAIHQKYGKKVTDSKEAMRILVNINTLADFILSDK